MASVRLGDTPEITLNAYPDRPFNVDLSEFRHKAGALKMPARQKKSRHQSEPLALGSVNYAASFSGHTPANIKATTIPMETSAKR